MIVARFLVLALLALAAAPALMAAPASAAYPERTIKLIVPFAPGGSVDVIGRLIAETIGAAMNQTVIVENHPGASGTIGSAMAAKAPPDGYTLLLGIAATHAIQPALGARLPYDVTRDFTPIAQIGVTGFAVCVKASSPIRTMSDLVAAAKARREPFAFATGGVNSGGHLVGEAIKSLTRIDLTHVPYRGAAPAVTDLLAGHVDLAIMDASSAAPQAAAGAVRVIAVAGPGRSSALPDVPTLVEQNIAFGLGSWIVIFGPARLEPAVVGYLNEQINQALDRPAVRLRLNELGFDPAPVSPDGARALQQRDIEVWRSTIGSAGIKFQ
jgi:tripartite-type tricarboxylate transporter receptor subunit TctC